MFQKLCSTFVDEYRNVLPLQIYLELPCRKSWKASFSRLDGCIENLEEMMNYYGIKPYHMIILHYFGGNTFKVNIFNECAVEIRYHCLTLPSTTKIATRSTCYLSNNVGIFYNDVELQKIRGTLSFNANVNFLTLYEYKIQSEDLQSENKYQVE